MTDSTPESNEQTTPQRPPIEEWKSGKLEWMTQPTIDLLHDAIAWIEHVEAERDALKAELAALQETHYKFCRAMGLLSTLSVEEMDIDNPEKMAEQILETVRLYKTPDCVLKQPGKPIAMTLDRNRSDAITKWTRRWDVMRRLGFRCVRVFAYK